jgi:hypothetical protein
VIEQIQPGLTPSYTVSSEQRRFIFQAVLVPAVCKLIIKKLKLESGKIDYWLWEYGTYMVAFERLALEMHLRKAIDLKSGQDLLSLLSPPGLDYRYWMGRFDQWRGAARASYGYFIKKQSPRIKKSARPSAAHLGTIKNLSGGNLPENLFSGAMARINADPVARAEFKKTAKKVKRARWSEPALDTWLIEIWPLVTEYGWNYQDVWQVANQKWDVPEASAFKSVETISDRCKKMLDLTIAQAGRAKQGRPKKVAESDPPIVPPMAGLAIWIRSIGDDQEEWIRGQF